MVALTVYLLAAVAAGPIVVDAARISTTSRSRTTTRTTRSSTKSSTKSSSTRLSTSKTSSSLVPGPTGDNTARAEQLIDQLNGDTASDLMTDLLTAKDSSVAQQALVKAGYGGLNVGDVLGLYPMEPYSNLANLTCFVADPPTIPKLKAGWKPPVCPDASKVYPGALSGSYSIDTPDALSDVTLTFDGKALQAKWDDNKQSAVTVNKDTVPATYYWTTDGVGQFKVTFNADFNPENENSPDLRVTGVLTNDGKSTPFKGTLNPVQVDPESLTNKDDSTRDEAIAFGVGLPCLVGLGTIIYKASKSDGQDIETFMGTVQDKIDELKRKIGEDHDNPANAEARKQLKAAEDLKLVAAGTYASLTAAHVGLVDPLEAVKAGNEETLAEMKRASQVAATSLIAGINMGAFLNTPSSQQEFETVTKNVMAASIKESLKAGTLTEKDVLNYDAAKINANPTSKEAKAWASTSKLINEKLISYFGDTIRQHIRENQVIAPLLTSKLLTTEDYNAVMQQGINTIQSGPAGELVPQYQALAVVDYGRGLIATREKTAEATLKRTASLTSTGALRKKRELDRKAQKAANAYSKEKNKPDAKKNKIYEAFLRRRYLALESAHLNYAHKVNEALEDQRVAQNTLDENKEAETNLNGQENTANVKRTEIEKRVAE